MKAIYLKRNWWIAILGGPVLVGSVAFCIYETTWPAMKAAQRGEPLPATWSWPAIIIVDVALTLMFGALIFIMLFQFRIVFTAEGVRMPGIFRNKYMRWNDVRYVDGMSNRSIILKLTDEKQSITINKLYYQQPEKLMSLIVERVPQSCYWRD